MNDNDRLIAIEATGTLKAGERRGRRMPAQAAGGSRALRP